MTAMQIGGKRPPWWRPIARWRWNRLQRAALTIAPDMPRRFAAAVELRTAGVGLEVSGDCSAAELIVKRVAIPRTTVWRDVEASEAAIFRVGLGMLDAIAREHGVVGRVWTLPLLGIVHLVYNDGVLVMADREGRPTVRLRAVYYHEANGRSMA